MWSPTSRAPVGWARPESGPARSAADLVWGSESPNGYHSELEVTGSVNTAGTRFPACPGRLGTRGPFAWIGTG
jgi:hypothetical protein